MSYKLFANIRTGWSSQNEGYRKLTDSSSKYVQNTPSIQDRGVSIYWFVMFAMRVLELPIWSSKEVVTTSDVVERVIKPLTKTQRCFFDLVPREQTAYFRDRISFSRPYSPTFFSHAWNMSFVDLVIGICKAHDIDAAFMRKGVSAKKLDLWIEKEVRDYVLNHNNLDFNRWRMPKVFFEELQRPPLPRSFIWLDFLSVWQHKGPHQLSDLEKLGDCVQAMDVVMLMDPACTPLSRSWCLFEFVKSIQGTKKFRMCLTHFWSKQTSNPYTFDTIEQQIGQRSYSYSNSENFLEVLLKYIDEGLMIDIQKAEASRAEDKKNIDKMIVETFKGSWEKANTFVTRKISEMLRGELSDYFYKEELSHRLPTKTALMKLNNCDLHEFNKTQRHKRKRRCCFIFCACCCKSNILRSVSK